MNSIRNFIFSGNRSFQKGAGIFLVFFFITRLPYYLYYPVDILSNDSASYIAAALSLLSSVTPLFDIRTPGYPVFLVMIWTFSKSIFAVSVMQSAFSFFTGVIVIFLFDKIYKKFTVLFACFLTVYMTSSYFLLFESALLTEGIFTNTLLICTALMMISVKENKNQYWAMFSGVAAILILIRPAGLFFVGIMILILFYFVLKKYRLIKYILLILPFTVIIISLCTYNFVTLEKFTVTPFGEANLSGVTVLFMETSDEYPDFVNSAIQQTLDSIPNKDKSYIKNYYGVTKLFNVFKDNFYRQMNFAGNLMGDDTAKKYMDIQPYMRIVSLDAIKKNPLIYLKFFSCNFIYFFKNLGIELKYFDQLLYNYNKNVVRELFIKELDKKKWLQISSDRSINDQVKSFLEYEIIRQKKLKYIIKDQNDDAAFENTIFKSIYECYENIYNFFFRNIVWYAGYFSMFILSIMIMLKTKFSDPDAFIAFLLFMIFLLKALLVSLVESSLERYSYTVEFAVYFSIPFLLILIMNLKNMKIKTKNI